MMLAVIQPVRLCVVGIVCDLHQRPAPSAAVAVIEILWRWGGIWLSRPGARLESQRDLELGHPKQCPPRCRISLCLVILGNGSTPRSTSCTDPEPGLGRSPGGLRTVGVVVDDVTDAVSARVNSVYVSIHVHRMDAFVAVPLSLRLEGFMSLSPSSQPWHSPYCPCLEAELRRCGRRRSTPNPGSRAGPHQARRVGPRDTRLVTCRGSVGATALICLSAAW